MSRTAGDKSETLRGLNGPTAPRKGLPIMADAVFKWRRLKDAFLN